MKLRIILIILMLSSLVSSSLMFYSFNKQKEKSAKKVSELTVQVDQLTKERDNYKTMVAMDDELFKLSAKGFILMDNLVDDIFDLDAVSMKNTYREIERLADEISEKRDIRDSLIKKVGTDQIIQLN